MKKTAKEHFKTMYKAVRLNRIPSSIARASLDASEDFGRVFAVELACAAREATDPCFQQRLQDRLAHFKCTGELVPKHARV
ncbi:hypothetical protein [Photobacterium swingsii]|nr:hypothetical protein [Photobacterium swingsii]